MAFALAAAPSGALAAGQACTAIEAGGHASPCDCGACGAPELACTIACPAALALHRSDSHVPLVADRIAVEPSAHFGSLVGPPRLQPPR